MTEVIVVEDEAIISMQLTERLKHLGYNVVGCAYSGEDSINMARELTPDLVLMDIVMPGGMDGIEAGHIINRELDIPIIFITAWAEDEFVDRAKYVEPFGYIIKPFQINEVKAAIEVALHKKKAERALADSEERMRAVIERLDDAVVSSDIDNGILYMNPAAEYMFGTVAENVKHDMIYSLFDDDGSAEFRARLDGLVKGTDTQGYVKMPEITCVKADGSHFPVEVTLVPNTSLDKTFVNCIIHEIKPSPAPGKTAGKDDKEILAICSYCKKIRNDEDVWHEFERYMIEHHDIRFSHSICPTCVRKYYPEL